MNAGLYSGRITISSKWFYSFNVPPLDDKLAQAIESDRLQRGARKATGTPARFGSYSPTHNVHDEWVYNRADIDASQIVWAREMTPEERPFI